MKSRGFRIPPGAEILDASGRGGTGNVVLLFRHFDPPRVLKIYRTRRSRLREAMGHFAHRFIEGKCGARATDRCKTEQALSQLWRDAGFDVVQRLSGPAPEGMTEPFNWLEWFAGPTLQTALKDPAVPLRHKQQWLEQLGRTCARRHRLAIDQRNALFIHERGHVAHVFVDGDRLVFFDLENAYRPEYPAARAAAREWAGFARSILAIHGGTALLEDFKRGYGDKELYRLLLDSGLRGKRSRLLHEHA